MTARRGDANGGSPQQDMLVLINLWNDNATVTLPWPRAGSWQERIEGVGPLQPRLTVGAPGNRVPVTVPGAVYLWSSP